MQMKTKWCTALAVLLAGVTHAQAQVQEVGADELELGSQPRLELQLGRSTLQRGFALDIEGGVPWSSALLKLERAGAAPVLRLVQLDQHGFARQLERNWDLDQSVLATCVLRSASGPVTRSVTIPAASQLSAPQMLLAVGDIVITEIMKDPTTVGDTAGEWIEIRNRTAQPINLEGWRLTDAGSNAHTLHGANGVWVPARSYFVLGLNLDPALNGGVAVDYKYSSFSLGNGADDVRLSDPAGVLIDAVSYDDGIFWPDTPGKSISLERALVDAALNDDAVNWCDAPAPMSVTNSDCGTPRRANNVCP